MRVSANGARCLSPAALSLARACGVSAVRPPQAPRDTDPAARPSSLTPEEKQVWAPSPPDRSAIPVLLYHGIGAGERLRERGGRRRTASARDDFAKQMTMIAARRLRDDRPADVPRLRAGQAGRPPAAAAAADLRRRPSRLLDRRRRHPRASCGFNAVMFVDVGRVEDGDPEYLTWEELETVQDERPLAAAAPLRRGPHSRSSTAPDPTTTGRTTPTRSRTRTSTAGASACASDIEWGQETLADHISRLPAARLRSAVRQLRPGRHQRPADPRTTCSAG